MRRHAEREPCGAAGRPRARAGGESGLGPPLTLTHFVSLSKSLPAPPGPSLLFTERGGISKVPSTSTGFRCWEKTWERVARVTGHMYRQREDRQQSLGAESAVASQGCPLRISLKPRAHSYSCHTFAVPTLSSPEPAPLPPQQRQSWGPSSHAPLTHFSDRTATQRDAPSSCLPCSYEGPFVDRT